MKREMHRAAYRHQKRGEMAEMPLESVWFMTPSEGLKTINGAEPRTALGPAPFQFQQMALFASHSNSTQVLFNKSPPGFMY